MRLWHSWRGMRQLRCQYSSLALPRFSQLALQPTTKAVVVAVTRRGGKGKERREAVGRIHRRRKKGHHDARGRDGRSWEMSAGKLEEGKKGRDERAKEWEGGGIGWDRTGDSLRQPRRQINMPGRAISNIRRSRRVGASCVRARELRWWRSTAGRIRDRLARPVAIASADRKVNGRRSAGIKDPLASPACSKDESLWTSFDTTWLGKTWTVLRYSSFSVIVKRSCSSLSLLLLG